MTPSHRTVLTSASPEQDDGQVQADQADQRASRVSARVHVLGRQARDHQTSASQHEQPYTEAADARSRQA
jgi:hypothetical protein